MDLILNGSVIIKGDGDEVWTIRQDPVDHRFYLTSTHGYNGYEGLGCSSLIGAMRNVQRLIGHSVSTIN